MRLDLSDDAFYGAAARWLAGLDNATLGDLEAVFAISPGYYPTTLYEVWQAEIARRGLPLSLPALEIHPSLDLPVSHPQECDWRFTPQTTNDLLDGVTQSLTHGASIVHLGTPSTFRVGYRSYPLQHHVLLERNAAMTSALAQAAGGVLTVDLCGGDLPVLTADAAILDPPWYPADTLAFLDSASRLSRDGASIWLCQPTLATRPGVARERVDLLKRLPDLGLILLETRRGAVRYQMPHFEAMSLRFAAGDVPIPSTWRTGDLLVLRKVGLVTSAVPPPTTDEQWTEVRFGPVRIKIRESDAVEDLAPLVPGDVLATVSRRDATRPRIGFWTSGNRVYGMANPDRVGQIVSVCDKDLLSKRFSITRTLEHAQQVGLSASTAQRLFDVLLVELQEHMNT